jgi:carbon storage regulator
MLVLSRKVNQSVMIGDDIEIILLETKGDTAKIGIVAPRDVKVFRQEVYQAIKAENQRSAEMSPAIDAASELLKNALQKRKKPE